MKHTAFYSMLYLPLITLTSCTTVVDPRAPAVQSTTTTTTEQTLLRTPAGPTTQTRTFRTY